MGIQDFPVTLQPLIQQGFLEREFQQGLHSRIGYRAVADREKVGVRYGKTLPRIRARLKPATTIPLSPATNAGRDNGFTPTTWEIERYTLAIDHYAATKDLNLVTSRVGIASQFLMNAFINGEQAARSLDELARKALFFACFGGNTRVRTSMSAASSTISVDDLRGFQTVFMNNVETPVSASAPLTVMIGANAYELINATACHKHGNLSTAWGTGGISGTLTLSTPVTVADGTANSTVTAANASVIIRPSGRSNTANLVAGDVLTMSNLLDAVAQLHLNAVPKIDGVYNCYLDPVSARQLFADDDFRQLFQGVTSANQVFRQGTVNDFLGLRFIPTTEAYVQPHPDNFSLTVRRPIVCGQGALIEGDFAGMAEDDIAPKFSIVTMIDGVAMVTREPIDRLQQVIGQSWYWIGGFCAPFDTTTDPYAIPTATNAAYKRAVMIEHIG